MKCENIFIEYVPSDNIVMQGKRSAIQKYLNANYYIKEDRNGYWVLAKNAQVNVNVCSGKSAESIGMKRDILDFYGEKKISMNLVEKFEQDIKNGIVGIYKDKKGNYIIKKQE